MRRFTPGVLLLPADAQAVQDGLLPLSHLALHGALVQVVIAQQVKDRVYRQIAHLPLQAVAELPGLGRRPLQGDAHVPKGA